MNRLMMKTRDGRKSTRKKENRETEWKKYGG